MAILRRALAAGADMGSKLLLADYTRQQELEGKRNLLSLEEDIRRRLQDAANEFTLRRDEAQNAAANARLDKEIAARSAEAEADRRFRQGIEDRRAGLDEKRLGLDEKRLDLEAKRLQATNEQLRKTGLSLQVDESGRAVVVDLIGGKARPIYGVDGNPLRIPMKSSGQIDLNGLAKLAETVQSLPEATDAQKAEKDKLRNVLAAVASAAAARTASTSGNDERIASIVLGQQTQEQATVKQPTRGEKPAGGVIARAIDTSTPWGERAARIQALELKANALAGRIAQTKGEEQLALLDMLKETQQEIAALRAKDGE